MGIATYIFVAPPHTLSGFLKGIHYVLLLLPSIYILATAVLVAVWGEYGWLWGVGSFLVASAVFSHARNWAWKRELREVYKPQLNVSDVKNPDEVGQIALQIMATTRHFWPPGR